MSERGSRWRAGAGVALGAGIAVLAAGACVPLAGAGYAFDLVANLAAAGLVVGLIVALWLVACRRWCGLALACAGCGLMAWPLAGRARPARGAGSPVRVLVFNSSANAGDAGEAMGLIASVGADVVVLTEPSAALLDLVRDSAVIGAKYPGLFLPERAAGGYLLVLSVWPQSPVLGERPADVARGGVRVMRVERPDGPFVLLAMHPDSPRSPAEWAKGNARVREGLRLVKDGAAVGQGAQGLPVIVAADMNSTPSGWRSREVQAAGFLRAKPIFAGGTYPAGLPGVLRIAIDDVWVGPGCGVGEWRTLAGGGSDHAPVLVTVTVSSPGPGQAGAAGGR